MGRHELTKRDGARKRIEIRVAGARERTPMGQAAWEGVQTPS